MTPEVKYVLYVGFGVIQFITMLVVSISAYAYKRDQAAIKENQVVVKEKQHEQGNEIVQLRKDQNEIKDNYLSRFDEVKNLINGNHGKVIEKINNLELSIAKKGQ